MLAKRYHCAEKNSILVRVTVQFIQKGSKKKRKLYQSTNQVSKQQLNCFQSIHPKQTSNTANDHKNVMFSEIFQNTQIIRFASVQFHTRTHNKSNSIQLNLIRNHFTSFHCFHFIKSYLQMIFFSVACLSHQPTRLKFHYYRNQRFTEEKEPLSKIADKNI